MDTSPSCPLLPGPGGVLIRQGLRPGDVGRVISLHGEVYHRELGFSPVFEGYVAKTFYDFMQAYDPARDRLWLAERGDELAGCIGVAAHGRRAQLRWFVLRPAYRGLGLGKLLLGLALDYCRQGGFDEVFLDTTGELAAARALYERAGFVQVSQHPNDFWQPGLTELTYEMKL